MGLLTNLVSRKGEYSFDDFTNDVRKRLYGGKNAAGAAVNEDTALRFITVFSCVRVLAEGVGSLPLFVYKKRRDGGKDKADDHPVYRLLHDLPNDEMTSRSWREAMIGHLATSGNCYSILTRNKRGQVEELYPVSWTDCRPVRNREIGKIEYHLNDRGKSEAFPAERVFHIPGFGFDGIMGYSPIRMAAEAMEIGMSSSEFTTHFYRNGMNIGGVIEHPQALSDAAFARLQEWVNEKGVGLGNSWKPFILEEGMKFARIPMPFVDAQFMETRKLNRDEICGLFRVPRT